RRLLVLDAARRRYHLRLLAPTADVPLLGGEALCHVVLREDPGCLILARGPMPFLSGNKLTVGYRSPLTRLPHYSFVGGRAFAELLNLGLDAIVFRGDGAQAGLYAVVSGRAPALEVAWRSAADLPRGQRSAYYWLLARELDSQPERGSCLTIGEGAYAGYRTANVAVDAIYHAGRGGAGLAFSRHLSAIVLRGRPMAWDAWLGPRAEAFLALREGAFRRRLERYTERLSRRDGGTVAKLCETGCGEDPTLPAQNARRLGYPLADVGARRVLHAHRAGQTGCHWCQVNCRHWHWVEADYAPGGRDRFLDDFEPAYAILAMLDLRPERDSTEGRLALLEQVDRRVVLPVEEMGCDVIDVGVGLAALFEGLDRGLVPAEDLSPALRDGPWLGHLDAAARAADALRSGAPGPALRAVGDGPQALAARYPMLQDVVFTGGSDTLGNAGHANQLWTFLMPFGRFFGHYVGQFYKIEGMLPPPGDAEALQALFARVVREALQREFFGVLCNALSTCAFTFVVFSDGGEGITLDGSDLLVDTLACYGIETRREELEWFAEAFWARSVAFKLELGWQPPAARDYPARVFEALSQALDRTAGELEVLMDRLIAEWKRQAGEILHKYGYEVADGWLP
ncbi:MAG: aldehyde ferredoxin oxidoreductase N-terminal domain-containing protein, partial [Anaerolineae bacterium]